MASAKTSVVLGLGGVAVGALAMWLAVGPRTPADTRPATDAMVPEASPSDAPPQHADDATDAAPDPALELLDAGLPRQGQWRQGFALVDLDGDHRLDLVHGPARKGLSNPVVFRGVDHLRFAPWALEWPDGAYDYGDVVVADLDGDGDLDLVFAAHLQGLRRLDGDGPGRFVARALPELAATFSSRALVATDIDRDGALELYALADGPGRDGQGRRGLLRVSTRAPESATVVPGSERLFGDGLAAGDGFVVVASAVLGASGMRCTDHCEPLAGVASDALVRAVDVLPDGAVVVASMTPHDGDWQVAVDVISDGHATRRFVEPGPIAITALAHADLDRDGVVDLIATRDDGELLVLTTSRLVRWPAPSWRRGCGGFGLAAQDLDGDGRAELLMSFAGEPGGERPPRCKAGGGFELVRWR